MPTVLERIRKLNHIVRWLEKEMLATGGAQVYDRVCAQVKEDATHLYEVTLTHLEELAPPARVAHLPHCLLCYCAELWTLHWSPQPRQALALTHVADMPLLYRRISSGGVMTIFGQKYTERYEKRAASALGQSQTSEGARRGGKEISPTSLPAPALNNRIQPTASSVAPAAGSG